MKSLIKLLALLLILSGSPIFCSQILVTVSQQKSPFPLPKGTNLYSAVSCSVDARVISAIQLRQAAEGVGISFQDPSLNSYTLANASKVPNKLLTATKWIAGGIAVSTATITAFKAQNTNIGNAQMYSIISAGSAALAVGIPLAQSQLSGLAANAATLTSGIAAALLQDAALLAIPANGCGKSVMFFGSGELLKPAVAVIP